MGKMKVSLKREYEEFHNWKHYSYKGQSLKSQRKMEGPQGRYFTSFLKYRNPSHSLKLLKTTTDFNIWIDFNISHPNWNLLSASPAPFWETFWRTWLLEWKLDYIHKQVFCHLHFLYITPFLPPYHLVSTVFEYYRG